MRSSRVSPAVSGRTSAWRRALILLLVLAVVGGLVLWGMNGLGRWLVVADPLQPARAIVILEGHKPFRAMEAASIYRQGEASEIWLTRSVRSAEEEALTRLGLQIVREETYNREVLERLGVPATAVRLLNGEVRNTAQELRLVARELQRVGGGRVILVTSKPQSRRVRATWRALIGDSRPAIVRYATEDPFESSRWWQRTRDALAVSRELFGLMNVWAGFPVRPD